MAKRRYQIVLEAQFTGIDPIIRLRKALKVLLRSFGLKCVECREQEPESK